MCKLHLRKEVFYVRKENVVEKYITKELEAFGIRPAGKREWIPVEGLHFPHVDTSHNLSAGLQGVEFPFAPGTEIPMRRKTVPQALKESLKFAYKTHADLFAVASHNDLLYKDVIIPTINQYLANHNSHLILTPSIGYPIMDWWKEGFTQKGNHLVEGDYFQLMAKGKLPGSVKVVYMDFPGTFFSAKYQPQQLFDWMKKNPDVLFIIDQANIGFSGNSNAYNLLGSLPKHDNFIITHTTTKSFSVRVLAHAWASSQIFKQYGLENGIPITKGLTTSHMKQAIQLFHPANIAESQKIRSTIVRNREYLKAQLIKAHGPKVLYNAQLTQGHALIVNAKSFGFADGDAFSKALSIGKARKDGISAVPIGVKSTKYYTDSTHNPWVKDFVYISIPFDRGVMKDLCSALGVEEAGK